MNTSFNCFLAQADIAARAQTALGEALAAAGFELYGDAAVLPFRPPRPPLRVEFEAREDFDVAPVCLGPYAVAYVRNRAIVAVVDDEEHVLARLSEFDGCWHLTGAVYADYRAALPAEDRAACFDGPFHFVRFAPSQEAV